MNTVAIVAIVAMLFAFLFVGRDTVNIGAALDNQWSPYGAPPTHEVILYIDPPPARVMLNLSLPERNPRR